MVRNSDAKVPFTIKVIDGDDVNAFALPGGFLFVYTGLIVQAESEGELAAAMAHEIAHVAARHGTRQASREGLANGMTAPMILMGGWGGYAAAQAARLGIPVAFLSFSRAFEAEADMLGLQYLYKAGYDPIALVDIFERLQSLQMKKPTVKLLSSHPPNQDRIEATQKNIQAYLKPKPEYVVNTSEFNDVKLRVIALRSYRKIDGADSDRPTLRRAPGTPDDGDKNQKDNPDDRPTLKRPLGQTLALYLRCGELSLTEAEEGHHCSENLRVPVYN